MGIHYVSLLLDTRDTEAYKNWREEGYKFSRNPASIEPSVNIYVEVYKQQYKPEELPQEAHTEMLSTLESELGNISQAKYRPRKMVMNPLDVCFLFFKVEHNVYLTGIYAYPSIRKESEKNNIFEFFTSLSLQLKMLTTVGLERHS